MFQLNGLFLRDKKRSTCEVAACHISTMKNLNNERTLLFSPTVAQMLRLCKQHGPIK